MQTNQKRLIVIGCAAMQGHCDVVKLLYQHLVDSTTKSDIAIVQFVDEQDLVNGLRALHLASMEGHMKVIQYLVDTIEVDIYRKDFENRTPQEQAWNVNPSTHCLRLILIHVTSVNRMI
eukprot:980432_1